MTNDEFENVWLNFTSSGNLDVAPWTLFFLYAYQHNVSGTRENKFRQGKQHGSRTTYIGHARRAIGPTASLRALKDISKKQSFGVLAIRWSSACCCCCCAVVYPLPDTPMATTREMPFKSTEETLNCAVLSWFVIPSVRTMETWAEVKTVMIGHVRPNWYVTCYHSLLSPLLTLLSDAAFFFFCVVIFRLRFSFLLYLLFFWTYLKLMVC